MWNLSEALFCCVLWFCSCWSLFLSQLASAPVLMARCRSLQVDHWSWRADRDHWIPEEKTAGIWRVFEEPRGHTDGFREGNSSENKQSFYWQAEVHGSPQLLPCSSEISRLPGTISVLTLQSLGGKCGFKSFLSNTWIILDPEVL